MRISIIILLFLLGCRQPKPQLQYKEIVRIDTVHRVDTIYQLRADTVYINCTDKRKIDSLKTKLFLANYKVERVKYYVKICLRNPSQDKFLKGWIKRAVGL